MIFDFYQLHLSGSSNVLDMYPHVVGCHDMVTAITWT
jgi:hypothetical protein